MMKYVGLIVLSIGVALSAAYGARLAPEMQEHLRIQGEVQFRSQAVEEAHSGYCAAREEAGLDAADGCSYGEEDEAPPAPAAAIEETGPPTFEEALEEERAKLAALRASEEQLPDALADERQAWLSLVEANVEPSARAAAATPPSPETRLETWFGTAGIMFLVGVLLVITGAVIGRMAVKREATEGDKESTGSGPYREGEVGGDFGKLLEDLVTEIGKLDAQMEGIEKPEVDDFGDAKKKIEAMQLERFELLVGLGKKLQARHGIGAYAEVFGPLSSAERRVNRAWSALVDSHWPEASASVTEAKKHLGETRAVYTKL